MNDEILLTVDLLNVPIDMHLIEIKPTNLTIIVIAF